MNFNWKIQTGDFLIVLLLLLLSMHYSCNWQKKKEHKDKYKDWFLYNGEIVKIWKGFYDDGSIKSEGTFYLKDSAFKHHGYFFSYHPNGKIHRKRFYERDNIIGSDYEYFPNGQLYKYRFFNPLGQLCYIVEYDDNQNIVRQDGTRNAFYILDYESDHASVYSPEVLGYKKTVSLYTPDGREVHRFVDRLDQFHRFYMEIPNDTIYELKIEYFTKDTFFIDSLKLIAKCPIFYYLLPPDLGQCEPTRPATS